jgi:hypothetical protein
VCAHALVCACVWRGLEAYWHLRLFASVYNSSTSTIPQPGIKLLRETVNRPGSKIGGTTVKLFIHRWCIKK